MLCYTVCENIKNRFSNIKDSFYKDETVSLKIVLFYNCFQFNKGLGNVLLAKQKPYDCDVAVSVITTCKYLTFY